MSSVVGRKYSMQDIQLVEKLIERCLHLYMNEKEVINTLFVQDNIDPRFTEIVWQRLKGENQEFFNAHYLKLLVKEQIMEFNRLLSEQVDLMYRTGSIGMATIPTSNGSHVSPKDMQQPSAFSNSGSSIQSCVQGTIDVSAHGRKSGVSPNLFAGHNSNVELPQAINGKIVKTKAGYAGSTPFYFNPHVESRPVMGDASVSSFTSVEPNAEPLNDMLLDGNASLFGLFNQLPQGFGDLAVDFCNNSGLFSFPHRRTHRDRVFGWNFISNIAVRS